MHAKQEIHFAVTPPDPGPKVIAALSESYLFGSELNHIAPGYLRHLGWFDDLLENKFIVAKER